MTLKVDIENFQAVPDDGVQFEVDGFTVIVGKSNTGKSSIIRAIDGVMRNLSGDSFVREGKNHTRVELETDDHRVVWKKGDGFNDYIIDGEEYQKVGHHPPDRLKELGLRDVEVDGDSIPVLVAKQFDPIFLINPSKTKGSTAAKLISDIGSLGSLQKARKESTSDRRSCSRKLKTRREDLEEVEETLSEFEDFDDDVIHFQEVQSFQSEVHDLRDRLCSLESIRSKKEEIDRSISNLEGIEEVEFPSAPSFRSDLDTVRNLRRFRNRYTESVTSVEEMEEVEEIEIPDLDDLDDQVSTLDTLIEIKQTREGLKDEIETLEKEIVEIEDKIEDLHDQFHDLLEEAGLCPLCEREVQS